MKIEELGKIIHRVRKALGYATKEQIERGYEGETKFIIPLLKDAVIHRQVSCGGFNYKKLKSGNVEVTLATSFIIKKEQIDKIEDERYLE